VQHEVDVKDLINHVGAHILIETREEWKVRYAKLKPRRPCGVCGVNEVCGRKPTESIPYCAVWLTKRNASLRAHACKNFDVPQYSYRWAAKVSKRSPCTNVPIICSLCPGSKMRSNGATSTFIFKYNMPEHIKNMHEGRCDQVALNTLQGKSKLCDDEVSMLRAMVNSSFISQKNRDRRESYRKATIARHAERKRQYDAACAAEPNSQ